MKGKGENFYFALSLYDVRRFCNGLSFEEKALLNKYWSEGKDHMAFEPPPPLQLDQVAALIETSAPKRSVDNSPTGQTKETLRTKNPDKSQALEVAINNSQMYTNIEKSEEGITESQTLTVKIFNDFMHQWADRIEEKNHSKSNQ